MRLRDLPEFSALISAGALLTVVTDDGRINTMTVSWGCAGIIWGKEICTVLVRPQRHTFSLCEDAQKMTLTFFGEHRKSTLALCGTKSGADIDKFEACALKYTIEDGFVTFEDAKYTLKLQKLYADDLKKEAFTHTGPLKFYENDDFHRAYVCEVVE